MRQVLRELLEHFLIPGLAASMPWPVYFRLLRLLSACPWLLQDEAARAGAGHAKMQGAPPGVDWLQRHKLVLLVDRADAFLSATRSDRWLNRYLDRIGDWPSGCFLAVTFHYGNGLWAMRDMRRSGHPVSLVSIRFDQSHFSARRLPYWAALLRFREVPRAGSAPVIFTGGSTPLIRQALADQRCILGLIDVPPGQAGGGLPVRFLGSDMVLPAGMLKLARETGVPVAAFSLDFDWQTGRRRLVVKTLHAEEIQGQADELAAMLDRLLHEGAPAWQLWSCASQFRRPTGRGRRKATEPVQPS